MYDLRSAILVLVRPPTIMVAYTVHVSYKLQETRSYNKITTIMGWIGWIIYRHCINYTAKVASTVICGEISFYFLYYTLYYEYK
jgi:hypothetical protein